MPLLDHLRELRNRLVVSVVALLIATVASLFFYKAIFAWVTGPFEVMAAAHNEEGARIVLAFTNVADSFTLALKLSGWAAIFFASPVWLYQLWAFVTPGLHQHERRWGLLFISAAVPLFLAGAYVAYMFLPKSFDLLIGFNPDPARVDNIIGVDRYLSFVMRMFLVFGLAFLLPVFVVALNLVGVVTARQLTRAWRPVVLGAFVFAAVATPSGDPLTMTALAAPMLVLYFLAAAVCAATDRRRRRAHIDGVDYAALSDDEASPLTSRSNGIGVGAAVEPARPLVDDDVT